MAVGAVRTGGTSIERDDGLGRARAAIRVFDRECHRVGPGVARGKLESEAGSIGDLLAGRRDDAPVVGVRIGVVGIEERAGKGDAGPLVDRLVRAGQDVQVGSVFSMVTVPEP